VICFRLLAPHRRGGELPARPRGPVSWLGATGRGYPFAAPSALISLGFLLSWSTSNLWIVAVTVMVMAIGAYTIHIANRTGTESRITDSVRAVVTAMTVLLLLGSLLTVRLVVAPDPDAPSGRGFTAENLQAGLDAILQPLALAFFALAVWHFSTVRRGKLLEWFRRRWAKLGTPMAVLIFLVPAVFLFFLPVLFPADNIGAASLTAFGIATPEYAKILFVFAMAVIVSRRSERYDVASLREIGDEIGEIWRTARVTRRWRSTAGSRRVLLMKTRHLLYPLGLFIIVAVISAARDDFGTIVPALAATVAVTWIATRRAAARATSQDESRVRLVRVVKGYQMFLAAGLALFAVAAIASLSTDYIADRGKVWADPWAYRWDSACVTPAGPPLDKVPEGVTPCLLSHVANNEGRRSQMGKALAAVADGGLFGRGLADSESKVVPAGPTDFILAVMWNKLGGLVVLASSVLLVLLGAAIVRATRSPDDRPSMSSLFGAGLAGLVVGQHLFVFAATLNVIPHSGIPAPFLSRGGQATLATLLGVMLALTLAARQSRAPVTISDSLRTANWRTAFAGRTGTLTAAGLCLFMAAFITVSPYNAPLPAGSFLPASYAADRPVCPARQPSTEDSLSPPQDPEKCSTDRLAHRRTRIEIRFSGNDPLLLDRDSGRWEQATAQADGLTIEDLSGLVRVGAGDTGVIDQSFPEIIDGTAGTTLGSRLLPHDEQRPADGGLDLTIDPRLQHLIAEALRSSGPNGASPMAGGMVVIDARSGRVLAAASVPVNSPVYGPPVDRDAGDDWVESHPEYGQVTGPGGLDGKKTDGTCADEEVARELCWRWSYQTDAALDRAAIIADQQRYVGGNAAAKQLPDPKVNRAVGNLYGPGSTFKVVIAAAYLRAGNDPDRRDLDAPASITLSPTVTIRNSGGGACGAENGKVSLTQALSVSCNTAFVRLAQRLGWRAVAEQAARFGFHIGECTQQPVEAWLADQLAGAYGSCVPSSTDPVALGPNALGGQGVVATPLQIATMMAAVANNGVAVQPSIILKRTYPGSGLTVVAQSATTVRALEPKVNARLVQALALTATSGTARGLADAVGAPMWVKTGSNDVVPAREYVKVNSWLTGFMETSSGPIAFAVVQEAPDGTLGAARNRHLVTLLGKALMAP
jgi:cell division protein FtsW (lipid II flippase)